MSLKEEIFQACKLVWDINYRNDFHQLIRSLNYTPKEKIGTPQDRGQLGYIARQQHAQVLGYLLVDEKLPELNKNPLCDLSPLSSQEKQLLSKVHNLLIELNAACIKPIIDKIPNSLKALDPYCNFSYTNSPADTNISIQETFKPLINSFHSLNLVTNVLSLPITFSNKIPEQKYLEYAMVFIINSQKFGVHEIPEDVNNMFLSKQVGTPQYTLVKLLSSITSLRMILNNINQLLYQAFLSKKLFILNEDNTIQIIKNSANFVGAGLNILAQPEHTDIHVEVCDIILAKYDQYKLDKICSIEGIATSFSQESGHSNEYKLRILDDDLNPYFGFNQF